MLKHEPSTAMPKISVILTSFNHESYIREAIESVLYQTFSDFELIIWDDASTDASWSIIQEYKDPRVKAFRNETSRRAIYGVNRSIGEVAKGEFIAMHHSDDVWRVDKLAVQLALLQERCDVGAVFTGVEVIDEAGVAVTDENVFYTKVFDPENKKRHQWLRKFFLQGNALCHPSVLVRKQCYDKCGLYRYGLAQVGDFDMWIRLCMQYEIHVVPEPLVKFRFHAGGGNTSAIKPETRRRIPYEYFEILDTFLEIANVEDVIQIFPEACEYIRESNADTRYLLARIAIEKRPFVFSPLWGQMILFSMLNEPSAARRLEEWHGFTYIDFIQLSGMSDVFGYDEIARLRAELAGGVDGR